MGSFVDYQRRQFVTESGVRLNLRPVSALVVGKLQAAIVDDKPLPPLVEVDLAGEKTQIPNPDDPLYQVTLNRWSADRQQDLVIYIWTEGIADDPPQDQVDRLRLFFPKSSAVEIKYAWICELLKTDENSWGELTDAILGQNQVTPRGLDESMRSFPSNGGDHSSTELQTVTSTD